METFEIQMKQLFMYFYFHLPIFITPIVDEKELRIINNLLN